MKTELALSFIFDLARADDLERIANLLAYARKQGITVIREQLDGVRQALGPGPSGPVAPPPVEHPLQCALCRREFADTAALAYHATICRSRAPGYVTCPECGRPHMDTGQGRAQHRRFSHGAPRDPNPTPKEASCDG